MAEFSRWRVLTNGKIPAAARARLDDMTGIVETPLGMPVDEGDAAAHLVLCADCRPAQVVEQIGFLRRGDVPVVYFRDGVWPGRAAILLEARENWEDDPEAAISYLARAVALCTALGIDPEIVACWNLVAETTLSGRVGLAAPKLARLKERELAATEFMVGELVRDARVTDVPLRYFEGSTLRAANALGGDGSILAVFPYRLRKGLLRSVLGQSVTTFTYRNDASVASIPLWT